MEAKAKLISRNGKHARDVAAERGISEGALLASEVGSGATPLRPEWSAIWEALPTLGSVKTLTRNEVIVLEHWGTYAEGEGGATLDVRLFFRRWGAGFAVEEEGKNGVRSSLQFFDRHGDSVHKIFLEDPARRAAFDEIVARFRADEPASFEPKPAKVPRSGGDATLLREGWDQLKDTHDFVTLLARTGLERLQALELAGPERARPVPKESLTRVLERLAESQLPCMIFVANLGMMQIYIGKIRNVKPMAGWINVLDQGFNLHARESGIASSFVVRKPTSDGIVSSLELYDAAGDTLALLFSKRNFGDPESPEWRALLDTLETS